MSVEVHDVTEADLRTLAERGAAELDGADALELLAWTDTHFGGNYVVASNMQDAVLVDLAAKVRPGVDVLFLDTGYHFAETIGTRDAVEAVYDINVVNVTAEHSVAEQDRLLGKDGVGVVQQRGGDPDAALLDIGEIGHLTLDHQDPLGCAAALVITDHVPKVVLRRRGRCGFPPP